MCVTDMLSSQITIIVIINILIINFSECSLRSVSMNCNICCFCMSYLFIFEKKNLICMYLIFSPGKMTMKGLKDSSHLGNPHGSDKTTSKGLGFAPEHVYDSDIVKLNTTKVQDCSIRSTPGYTGSTKKAFDREKQPDQCTHIQIDNGNDIICEHIEKKSEVKEIESEQQKEINERQPVPCVDNNVESEYVIHGAVLSVISPEAIKAVLVNGQCDVIKTKNQYDLREYKTWSQLPPEETAQNEQGSENILQSEDEVLSNVVSSQKEADGKVFNNVHDRVFSSIPHDKKGLGEDNLVQQDSKQNSDEQVESAPPQPSEQIISLCNKDQGHQSTHDTHMNNGYKESTWDARQYVSANPKIPVSEPHKTDPENKRSKSKLKSRESRKRYGNLGNKRNKSARYLVKQRRSRDTKFHRVQSNTDWSGADHTHQFLKPERSPFLGKNIPVQLTRESLGETVSHASLVTEESGTLPKTSAQCDHDYLFDLSVFFKDCKLLTFCLILLLFVRESGCAKIGFDIDVCSVQCCTDAEEYSDADEVQGTVQQPQFVQHGEPLHQAVQEDSVYFCTRMFFVVLCVLCIVCHLLIRPNRNEDYEDYEDIDETHQVSDDRLLPPAECFWLSGRRNQRVSSQEASTENSEGRMVDPPSDSSGIVSASLASRHISSVVQV